MTKPNARWGGGIRLKKTLLTSEEKAHIVNVMRTSPHTLDAFVWAREFGRLPNTIRAIAAQAGVKLRE